MKYENGRKALFSALVGTMVGVGISLTSTAVLAEEETTTELDEVVVTGVARPVNRLESSVSTSSIDIGDVDSLAPRSTQELLRSIPGIRSESSGGEGNANVSIRGIPLATGGSKYVQYQEDGLPVLLFGDLNFANSDNFVRADWSVRRIESIRGGSASTFTTSAPGAIINFISNDGSVAGGAVGISYGVDYNLFRTDFLNSGKLNDDWSYSFGGFYHSGEGLRHTGFNGEQGGQIKLTLSRQLEGGFFKIHLKHLDDSVPTYMPAPILNKGGSFGNPPGIDLAHDSIYSPYQTSISTSDAYGNRVNRNVTKGINSKVDSIGFEFDKDMGQGWQINDKFRTSKIGGSWIAPFSDGGSGTNALTAGRNLCNGSTTTAGAALSNCATARVTYATGPNAGQNYNGLLINNLMFDVTFKDVGNLVNDLKLTKSFDDKLSVTVGYFNMHQNVAIDWNSWQYIYESLERNPVPLNVSTSGPNGTFGNADDQKVTSNGLYWPGLLSFAWDLQYDATAPYINLGGKLDRFNWDVSARRDRLQARGGATNICCGNASGFDYNNDNLIEPFEVRGRAIASATVPTNRANYTSSHTSYSLGGSFVFLDNMSVFARYSDGVSFPADRLLQISGTLKADGSLTSTTSGFDEVKQAEVGFKWTMGRNSFYATVFDTKTEETNAEITSGLTFQRSYKAQGLELEGTWHSNIGIAVNGNLTFMDAKVDKDKNDPTLNGVKPRRQAPYIFTISPSYQLSNWEFGLTAQGSGSYNLQTVPKGTVNVVKQNAYVIFNAYGSVAITDALSASLSVNNLTDKIVATEVEEGSAAVGTYVRGRLLTGRTTALALKYKF